MFNQLERKKREEKKKKKKKKIVLGYGMVWYGMYKDECETDVPIPGYGAFTPKIAKPHRSQEINPPSVPLPNTCVWP